MGGSIGGDDPPGLDVITEILTFIQLIMTIIVLVFCAIERYKITIHRFTKADSKRKIEYIKENAGLKKKNFINKATKIIFDFQEELNPEIFKTRPLYARIIIYIILVLSEFENIYNLIYLGVTCVGFSYKGPLIYGILLLDVVKRSRSLQQIIKSIT